MTEINNGDQNEAEYVNDGDEGAQPDEVDERYLPQDDQAEEDTAEDEPE